MMVEASELKEAFEAMRVLSIAFQQTGDMIVAGRLSVAVMEFCRLSDDAVREALAVRKYG